MIEIETRLRVGRGLAKTEQQASAEALRQLKRRAHPEEPPPLVSDGFGSNRGKRSFRSTAKFRPTVASGVPRRSGARPRAGSICRSRGHHDERGRFLGTTKRVVFGRSDKVASLSAVTSFVGRTHLMSRQMNARLVRKGLGFSKALSMHKAAAAWEDALYNLLRPLKTLRQEVQPEARRFERRYAERPPAMAAGLTDHIWSVKELLRTSALLRNNT